MKKGARITLTVFIRGEDEPAHDFLELAIGAITWAVGQISYFPGRQGLSVEIEEIHEDPGESLES